MGIFVAGVLKAIDEKLREHVVSVYGTSSGADVGVYFVANQTDIPKRFFIEHLTKPDFIRKNFLRYLLKLFIFRNNPRVNVKDYINVEYVAEVAKNSNCRLNLDAFEKSEVEFYVKVIDIASGVPAYIPAKTNVFVKLIATSQCGPLSTRAIEVDGRKYIDGGVLPNRLDIELAKAHPEKLFVVVQSQTDEYVQKTLLYPLYLLVGHALNVLFAKHLGKRYVQTLFTNYDAELRVQKNVLLIKNDLTYSSFCTDKKILERVYKHGIQKTNTILAELFSAQDASFR